MNEPLSATGDLLTHVEKLVKVLSPVFFTAVWILFLFISFLALLSGIAGWVGSKVNNYVLGITFVAVLIITTISFFTICQQSFIKMVRNKLTGFIYT